jgi:tetratricopeptide (TPR) repeat protein
VAPVIGDLEGAERALALAFEADPEMEGHGRYLAELYLDQGRNDEALEVVRTALLHRPDDEILQAFRDGLEAA